MQKWLITLCLFAAEITAPAVADNADVLQNRLNQVNSFHANFIQQIMSSEGSIIQEGKGELWVKRPNWFNWHMTYPDENVLVSDGKTLWIYNPFVQQVTANWMRNITGNHLFMLIIRSSTAEWSQYNVKQQGDDFLIVPKFDNGNLKQCSIKVTADGMIKGITTVEQDGLRSTYQLTSQKNGPVDASKFHFVLPTGVTLDDQRQ